MARRPRTRPGDFNAPRTTRRPQPWFGITGQTPAQLETGRPPARPGGIRPVKDKTSTGGQWLKAWQPLNPGAFMPGVSNEQAASSMGLSPEQFAAQQQRGDDPAWLAAYLKKNPGAGKPSSAGEVGPQGPAPYAGDAQYGVDVDALGSRRDLALAGVTRQESDVNTNMQEALRRMQGQREETLGDANRAYNRRGLLFSGALGKRRGDVEVGFQRQELDVRGQAKSALEELASRRAGANSDFTFGQRSAWNESVDRQIGRDEDAASRNALVPITDDPQPAPVNQAAGILQPKGKYPAGYDKMNQRQKSRYWARRRAIGRTA
jgi:hypothetical protein